MQKAIALIALIMFASIVGLVMIFFVNVIIFILEIMIGG
ncbi:hypothetical protein WC29P2_00041 [Weissella phage WC29P2]|nr:hypothetical protein WC29P1_00020 [Weissella phage WC29P1]WAX18179.1 hypothetical protein WC29P2_00041 [Weissella phage WC29P2]